VPRGGGHRNDHRRNDLPVSRYQARPRLRSHSRNHMSMMANGSVAQNRNGIGASSRRHSQRYGNSGRGCRRRFHLQ
jgi:hypothetical protein